MASMKKIFKPLKKIMPCAKGTATKTKGKAYALARKVPGLNRRKSKKQFIERKIQKETGEMDRRKYVLSEERRLVTKEREKEFVSGPAYTGLSKGRRRAGAKRIVVQNPKIPTKKITEDGKTYLARKVDIRTDRRSEEGSKVVSDRRGKKV